MFGRRCVVCVLLFCALAWNCQASRFTQESGTEVIQAGWLGRQLQQLGLNSSLLTRRVPRTTRPLNLTEVLNSTIKSNTTNTTEVEAVGGRRRRSRNAPKTSSKEIVEEVPLFTQDQIDAMFVNATKRNNITNVMKYYEMGANLNVTTGIAKRTVLHIAANTGGVEVARFLIEVGAEVDALTTGDATPLHVAAADNKDEVARLLLENGADITKVTINGNSALHWAATQGHPEVAQVLIQGGADREAINLEKKTPEEILCCCQCGEDSNCSCEDRGWLSWLLDESQSGDVIKVDPSLVIEVENEAIGPDSLEELLAPAPVEESAQDSLEEVTATSPVDEAVVPTASELIAPDTLEEDISPSS